MVGTVHSTGGVWLQGNFRQISPSPSHSRVVEHASVRCAYKPRCCGRCVQTYPACQRLFSRLLRTDSLVDADEHAPGGGAAVSDGGKDAMPTSAANGGTDAACAVVGDALEHKWRQQWQTGRQEWMELVGLSQCTNARARVRHGVIRSTPFNVPLTRCGCCLAGLRNAQLAAEVAFPGFWRGDGAARRRPRHVEPSVDTRG